MIAKGIAAAMAKSAPPANPFEANVSKAHQARDCAGRRHQRAPLARPRKW